MIIRITSASMTGNLDAYLDEDPPTVEAGYSIWEEVPRPKRPSVVNWQGSNPYQLSVPALFDGWASDTSVEPQCARLEALASSQGALVPPSPIRVNGPIPHRDLEWYIMEIAWGAVIYSPPVGDAPGFRLRQHFVMLLIERVDMVTTLRNEKNLKPQQIRYRIITVKKGYDLQQIASVTMGDSALWRRITNMKGGKFRDPYVKPGTKIKVPIL